MSDTSSTADAGTAPDRATAGTVSLNKAPRWNSPRGAGGSPGKAPSATVTPPRTINIVTGAFIAVVLANAARGLLLLGSTSTLRKYVTDVNNKAKKPVKNFDVANAVHTFRQGALVQAVIFGVALLLLAYAIRRTRTASGMRWAVLIVCVYLGLPLYIIPTRGLPPGVQVFGVVIGVASIVAIVLIFFPKQSQLYFRECRDANTPPDMRGKPRTGLASLFGPKRQPGQRQPAQRPARGGGLFGGPRGAAASTPTTPAVVPTARPSAAKAKAKVRADTEAIAKGAELARSRAKASKSRRTAD